MGSDYIMGLTNCTLRQVFSPQWIIATIFFNMKRTNLKSARSGRPLGSRWPLCSFCSWRTLITRDTLHTRFSFLPFVPSYSDNLSLFTFRPRSSSFARTTLQTLQVKENIYSMRYWIIMHDIQAVNCC